MQKEIRYDLRLGDSREVLTALADCSIDSVVCDPPYSLDSIVKRFGAKNAAPAKPGTDGAFARASSGFMGMTWDTGETAFSPEFWAEVLRVLKPGGYLLAFSGTRTYHRLACAIEDAGFEIRDMFEWIYGSGFPKSHDAGEGRGTALKPAHEPICMARKPLIGTVAENIAAYGTGALNIDKCRIEITEALPNYATHGTGNVGAGGVYQGGYAGIPTVIENAHDQSVRHNAAGRWPANIIHDGSDEVLEAFPEEAGASAPVRGDEPSAVTDGIFGDRDRVPGAFHGDAGSAARFFYCAKASKADREEGCEHLPFQVLARSNLAQTKEDGGDIVESEAGGFNAARKRKNHHPTVKPTALMAYLCRLVTPPGGLVMDPFMGSGSTGKAAILEGFRFIGIEREAGYMEIAKARVAFGDTMAKAKRQPGARDRKQSKAAADQNDLFARA